MRLQVERLRKNIIEATILTENERGETIIFKIPLIEGGPHPV
jgi:hypothetical protein